LLHSSQRHAGVTNDGRYSQRPDRNEGLGAELRRIARKLATATQALINVRASMIDEDHDAHAPVSLVADSLIEKIAPHTRAKPICAQRSATWTNSRFARANASLRSRRWRRLRSIRSIAWVMKRSSTRSAARWPRLSRRGGSEGHDNAPSRGSRLQL